MKSTMAIVALLVAGGAKADSLVLRWEGKGPASAAQAAGLLPETPRETSTFQTELHEVTPQADWPEARGQAWVEPGAHGGYELHVRYEATKAPPRFGQRDWVCTLSDRARGMEDIEVAVKRWTTQRRWVRHCQVNSAQPPAFPPQLQARPSGCQLQVTRIATFTFRVQEWQAAGRPIGMAVERVGHTLNRSNLGDFRRVVLRRMAKAGAEPVLDGQASLQARCR